MKFLECPDDGEQLKVVPVPERAAGEPHLVVCPSCGKRFTFGPGELTELPPEAESPIQ
jgi:hypothetical protein